MPISNKIKLHESSWVKSYFSPSSSSLDFNLFGIQMKRFFEHLLYLYWGKLNGSDDYRFIATGIMSMKMGTFVQKLWCKCFLVPSLLQWFRISLLWWTPLSRSIRWGPTWQRNTVKTERNSWRMLRSLQRNTVKSDLLTDAHGCWPPFCFLFKEPTLTLCSYPPNHTTDMPCSRVPALFKHSPNDP